MEALFTFVHGGVMRTREGNKEQDILDAAVKVFAEHGYHGAKMAKIAETAGVGTGSLYLYFKDKAGILDCIFERLLTQLAVEMDILLGRDDLTPADKLDGMIDLFFDMFVHNMALATVFVNELHNHLSGGDEGAPPFVNYGAFLDRAQNLFNQGRLCGEFNRDLDPRVYRHFIFGGVRRLIHEWARDPGKFPIDSIRRDVKYFIKYGIMVSPA